MNKELEEWLKFEAEAKKEIDRQIADIRRSRRTSIIWMAIYMTAALIALVLIIAHELQGAL